MYKKTLFAAIFFMTSVGFVSNSAAQYDSSDFSSEGRKFQPVPTGHIPGKNNGPGIGLHNAGEDCGICHKPYGKAPNKVFTMSGTLYRDRAARKPLKGGEVILQDVNGKVISMTSNEAGNFWTYEAIGGDPKGVIGKTPPIFNLYTYDAGRNVISKYPNNNADYPQAWTYKAWVKNGNQVIPMMTIAPVGGSTIVSGLPDKTSRMSCSMHHSPMGARGALWAGTDTLASYPTSGLSYKKHIQPIFKNKCIPCHIPGETWTRAGTKSDTNTGANKHTRVDYSGGIDLTSYAGSTLKIKDGIPGYQSCANAVTPANCVNNFNNTSTIWNKKGVSDPVVRGKILSTTDGASLNQHSGGKFWTAGNTDYEAIKRWIDAGGLNN